MKNKTHTARLLALCSLLIVGVPFVSFAAMVKLESGSLDALKQETAVNIVYSYEGMRVGKFVNEKDYVAQKVEERNKQEAGRGDRWRDEWIQNRAAKFQPKFQALLNKQFSSRKKPLQFGSF